jgi:putative redox protein
MSVTVVVAYEGSLHCTATHGPSQQTLSTDAPVDNGGSGAAFSPTDLVAAALGSCMLTIMGKVAQRDGLDLAGTHVSVVKEMVAQPTRRIGALRVLVTLPSGSRLSPADRSKLEKAAAACPVKQSLHPDVQVTVEFR